jgi:hypothetical protein
LEKKRNTAVSETRMRIDDKSYDDDDVMERVSINTNFLIYIIG